jgi:hypothetical protein
MRLLILAFGVIARAQPAPLAIDASAQGTTLTIVVFADAPSTLRITLPDGWTGAPHEQAVSGGVQVLSYELEPGAAVGQGTIVVQAWSGSSYVSDRAWVWGRVAESQKPAPRVRRWLPLMRR